MELSCSTGTKVQAQRNTYRTEKKEVTRRVTLTTLPSAKGEKNAVENNGRGQ